MTREDRAKQFAPFDALKGLSNALRLKEYQHERLLKGDLSEESVAEISKTLLEIESSDIINLLYFIDGHEFTEKGYCKINFDERFIKINDKKIPFDYIREIKVV